MKVLVPGQKAKKLIKIKKISSSPFGGDNVQMSGLPDDVLIKFAKKFRS